MHYFLDADPGATKTHSLIVDETGRALGFAESGPGNHESVGCDAMFESMRTTIHKVALNARRVRLSVPHLAGAAMLGMEAAGFRVTPEIRKTMNRSTTILRECFEIPRRRCRTPFRTNLSRELREFARIVPFTDPTFVLSPALEAERFTFRCKCRVLCGELRTTLLGM